MRETIERPAPLQLDEAMMGGFGGFPDRVYLISVGDNKFASNNVTLPDQQNVNGLACFPTPDDATTYMGLLAGLSGDIVAKPFEEAREIAVSKPILSCLLLFQGSQIVDVHWIR
ncbi:hypothetical protein MCEMSE15_01309 [Fimbriimonadaceae bacterium]|jgi:hypothetical protein